MAVPESSRKVMVAIDESESGYYTLMWVLKNLHDSINSSGNPLLIFIARPSPPNNNVFAASLGAARLYCPISANPEFVNSVEEKNKMVSMGILEKAKSICTSHGINAETIAEVGDAKVAICKAVQKHNITLLVLAGQKQGTIKRAFTWSVSDYCFQYAECNVLVVKKPE